MAHDDDNDQRPYLVLINDEEQYSLWLGDLPIPAGWRQAHGPAAKADCLSWVEQVWTDMRPRSLRERMARDQGNGC